MNQKLYKRTNYTESPTHRIAVALREKGYRIANFVGIEVGEPPDNVLGILEPAERIFLGLKQDRRQRSLYIGNLWIDDESRGAKHDENWVLEVYGRENVTKLTELVGELSDPEVSVQVRLKSEQSRVESYWSDYDF